MAKLDKKHFIFLLALIILMFFIGRKKGAIDKTDDALVDSVIGGNNMFYKPYYDGYPGSNDSGDIVFNSGDTNINVSNPALGMLDNNYIPLFGFVGVSAYGGV